MYSALGTWSNLSVGMHCITATLSSNGILLHSYNSSSCTTVVNSTGDISVSASTSGNSMQAWVNSYNLTVNSSYSMTWMLIQSSTNTTYDNGSFAWTAYNYSSTEYLSWSGLSSDWYCMNAYLYDVGGGMVGWDANCQYISNGSGNGTGQAPA